MVMPQSAAALTHWKILAKTLPRRRGVDCIVEALNVSFVLFLLLRMFYPILISVILMTDNPPEGFEGGVADIQRAGHLGPTVRLRGSPPVSGAGNNRFLMYGEEE